jgi:hypothetical protein
LDPNLRPTESQSLGCLPVMCVFISLPIHADGSHVLRTMSLEDKNNKVQVSDERWVCCSELVISLWYVCMCKLI